MAVAIEYPQAQISLTLDDISVLNYVKTLLRQMKGVRSVHVDRAPKIKMTEQEFYDKIDHSLESATHGPLYAMQAGESAEDFMNRITAAA